MIKNYKTIYLGGSGEIIEKKSRFIATVEPVEDEESALAFIEKTKKNYWDARHNCFAYIIGKENPIMRCSDDGEPSGTAGRPMLDVLTGADLCNVCVVVTRYFGGTLLGTGGLVRAYSKSVQEGLQNSVVIEKKAAYIAEATCDYNWVGKLQYLSNQMTIPILETEYTESASMKFLIPIDEKGRFISQVTEATSAKVEVVITDETYFSEVDGEYILFKN
ncbi:protein co-occurring with transport system [Lachnospiraceae bacterium TWA4]|nr:protein co-occurring with transport system [Lachnospiraceae bacterium TWA4]